MSTPVERRAATGLVFLTAPPELGAKILAHVQQLLPDVEWTVYARAAQVSELGSTVLGLEIVSDKPVGSKLAFLRAIRRRAADLAVIAWTGDRDFDRMKLVGLLGGAKRCLVYNENIDCFFLDDDIRLWLRHVRWRRSLRKRAVSDRHRIATDWVAALAVLSPRGAFPVLHAVAATTYKWTLGLLIGGSTIVAGFTFRRLLVLVRGDRWRTRASHSTFSHPQKTP